MSGAPHAVIGAGGHAKVVLSILAELGVTAVEVYDDDPSRWGSTILGVPIVGGLSLLVGAKRSATIAIGNNRVRERIAGALDLAWASLVHPRAYVDRTARVEGGAVVFAGAVIQPEAVVGAHSIVNTGATIDHDCALGPFVHVAPGVHLAGGVRLGRGVFMGIGSVAIPNIEIGPWSVVGAGAVCVRDLPGHTIAVGVPARAKGHQ